MIEYIKKIIKNDKVSHAYLIYGGDQERRLKIVLDFVKCLMCVKKDGCGACIHCVSLAKKNHPDIYFVKKEDGKKDISIGQVRAVVSQLQTTSFLDSYKIGVVSGVENLNLEASNALLKTLEEPPKKVVIILSAERIDLLPTTIISRCEVIKLPPHFKESDGDLKDDLDLFLKLTTENLQEKFKAAEYISTLDRDKIEQILKNWLKIARKILICRICGRLETQLSKFDKYPIGTILAIIKSIIGLRKYLRENINIRLALEDFALETINI